MSGSDSGRMGLNLKDLVVREKTTLESFSSRTVAIDAYNALYQFLATIRGPDGSQLADSEGNVTSHLSGLFYRNINYLSMGIRPVYVFDGKPPSLKSAEISRRKKSKKDAEIKYERAVSEGNLADARKYAQQTTSMSDGMVDDSKKLLDLFGIAHVSAPSEGEATAARMTQTGDAYASASQDYDSVLFGAKRLVRNFTTGGRRKIPNRNTYVEVVPETIEIARTLRDLNLTREQLVDMGILIGTDFNPDGFERVGPKTALKMMRDHARLEDIPGISEQLETVDYEQIRKIFLEPQVPESFEIQHGQVQYEGIIEYLAGSRSFSSERLQPSLNRLKKSVERRSQNLDKWF